LKKDGACERGFEVEVMDVFCLVGARVLDERADSSCAGSRRLYLVELCGERCWLSMEVLLDLVSFFHVVD